jgi:hypothetical protein
MRRINNDVIASIRKTSNPIIPVVRTKFNPVLIGIAEVIKAMINAIMVPVNNVFLTIAFLSSNNYIALLIVTM